MSIFLPPPTSLHEFGLIKETRCSRTLEYVITVTNTTLTTSLIKPFHFSQHGVVISVRGRFSTRLANSSSGRGIALCLKVERVFQIYEKLTVVSLLVGRGAHISLSSEAASCHCTLVRNYSPLNKSLTTRIPRSPVLCSYRILENSRKPSPPAPYRSF